MPTPGYDSLRHFADSWGLLYMFCLFVLVAVRLVLPGAAGRARAAAEIPLREDSSSSKED
jgi:cytochrome c oxidase cbb3-type subunit 4